MNMANMTMAEKILSQASKNKVSAGEFTVADVDLVFAHDGTALLAIDVMRQEFGLEKIFDPSRVIFVIDHAAPSPAVGMSIVHKVMRAFARKHGIKLYDVGNGICHQIIPENGHVKPGMVVIGADSHTVTHGAFGAFATGVGSTDAAIAMMTGKIWLRVPETLKIIVEGELKPWLMSKDIILHIIGSLGSDGANYLAVEFHGKTITELNVDSRMTLTNMVVEMGAKAGLIPVDAKTIDWLRLRVNNAIKPITPDADAEYVDELHVNVENLEPQVAAPPNVDNVKSISEVEGLEVDQVFIGSCTNGRFEDFFTVAKILKGRRINENTRCIVIPASKHIYTKLLKLGILEVLISAGCVIGPPTCGPCVSAHMGILGPDEVAVSTSNRNFPGRMGDKKGKIYLASPATAAATAVEGKIADPRKYLR